QCSFILLIAKKLTFSKSVLNSLYYAFGYSHLVYMPHIWGYSLQNNLNQLQNRCMRIIYNANWFHPNATIFKELQMLNIDQIIAKFSLIFIYKLLHSNINKCYSTYDIGYYRQHTFHSRLNVKNKLVIFSLSDRYSKILFFTALYSIMEHLYQS